MSDESYFQVIRAAGTRLEFPEPFMCEYKPLPDITTQELARVVGFLVFAVSPDCHITREMWEALGDAKRHLPEIKI